MDNGLFTPFMPTKVSKGAKNMSRCNQVPHPTQDTNGKVTNSQLDTTNESQEVSPIILPASVYHIACFRLSTYLYVLFVYVSVCASIQLEIHSPENTNMITDVRALACSTFHFIFNFFRYYI